jgi:hypothetical protein
MYQGTSIEGAGIGETRAIAKREACAVIKTKIEKKAVPNSVIINYVCYSHEGKNYHSDKCKQAQPRFKSKIAFVRFLKEEYPAIINYTPQSFEEMRSCKCTSALDEAIQGYIQREILPKMQTTVTKLVEKFETTGTLTPEDVNEIDQLTNAFDNVNIKGHKNEIKVKANMGQGDQSVQPATAGQAMQQNQNADIPQSSNPQFTSIQPIVRQGADELISSLEVGPVQTLNPAGAPNMLSVGGILFDIKTLIYTQYLDAGQQWTMSEAVPTGGILFQIGYGVLTPFVNAYIKAYALLHERFTGIIMYKLMVVGNQILSGMLGVCWHEKKVEGNTISLAEAQKVSSSLKGVNLPYNEVHALFDARDTKFYRKMEDEINADLSDRPHLVVFAGMSFYNPYRDDALVRVRVQSKLSTGGREDGFAPAFLFSLPTIARISGQITSSAEVERTFNDAFPHALNGEFFFYTDGESCSGTQYKDNTYYPQPHSKAETSCTTNSNISHEFNELTNPCSGSFMIINDHLLRWDNVKTFWQLRLISDPIYVMATSVYISSTADSVTTANVLAMCPYDGISSQRFDLGLGNLGATEEQWHHTRDASRYNKARVDNPPNIIAILGNDTSFNLGEYEVTESNSLKVGVMGLTKIVTDQGVITLTLLTSSIINGLRRHIEVGTGLIIKRTLVSQQYGDFDMPDKPNLNIDSVIGSLNFESLPAGYQALRITSARPSSMIISAYPGPTACDDSVIVRWFHNRYKNLALTQCAEMTLVDAVSVRIIATIRYLQEYRLFVINTLVPNYRALQISTSNIVIQSLNTTPRTNSFTDTDTSRWFDRTGNNYARLTSNVPKLSIEFLQPAQHENVLQEVDNTQRVVANKRSGEYGIILDNDVVEEFEVKQRAKFELTQEHRREQAQRESVLRMTGRAREEGCRITPVDNFNNVTSNAFLASMLIGAAGGIGQEGSKMLDRKHQSNLQSKEHEQQRGLQQEMFGHNEAMQKNQFGQDALMQSNLFGQQTNLQYNEHNFQEMMQSSRQDFEKEMNVLQNNEQRITNRMDVENRMTERGLGTRAQFLNQKFQF